MSSESSEDEAELLQPPRRKHTSRIMPLFAGRQPRRFGVQPPADETAQAAPETDTEPAIRRPRIPKPIQSKSAGETTPLPILPLTVLSITMLGEFLSANVSTPFILKMVEGFGVANVGSWGGNLVASFFITQFLTSLLWATIAEKHGARLVLFVSLLGTALTCALFGTSTTLPQAFAVRLMQGVFAGAIGVARGTVSQITDSSNEGRAYSIIGFCWGFGGVVGAIIGGSLESPVAKWPETFSKYGLFVKYPYLLPCITASSITLVGAVLSLFLGRDGGLREGAIRLLPEKLLRTREETSIIADADPEARRGPLVRLSSFVPRRFRRQAAVPVPEQGEEDQAPVPTPKVDGAAYGYSTARPRLPTSTDSSTRLVAEALRRRRGSGRGAGGEDHHLNFAQRLLMANETNVMSMTDLWVAAAINVESRSPLDEEEDEEDRERGRAAALLDAPRPRLTRRASSSTSALPAIFTHTGVKSRVPAGDEEDVLPLRREPSADSTRTTETTAAAAQTTTLSQLPLFIIFQYGLLALHSTTHDQVFLSYLSSAYKLGGLGLAPAGYAQLIALMSFAQISYQFYLYPNIGPPRGRFSHLNMFRIGSALYIPSYLSVILYRVLASKSEEGGGGIVIMSALALSTAVRYCGSTFAYTSIVILLNYVSPPHAVGLANGLAQSIVSLARFLGPILGGYLWSASVQDNPAGYPLGFLVCSGVCFVAILLSFFVR
ncbi:major facilitator superfamily MFS-1 [Exidia glandulosa HHB12029]|uniref:Major facilitator superfamily MFS-1 n=1 Tax=Exidia glandulosa HHB12029 TaxID=1314781 RepID=A0A166B202_EXIGL|nr:major facilitator superfamily MFS-1 [Exidia glandulosa HHB12029]